MKIHFEQFETLFCKFSHIVTGWGRLSEGGTLPSVLQEVQVPIVSNDRCKMMFLRAGRHEFIPDIFLCAGHDSGGHDSCQVRLFKLIDKEKYKCLFGKFTGRQWWTFTGM